MRLMAAKRSSNRFRSLLGVSLAVLTLVGSLVSCTQTGGDNAADQPGSTTATTLADDDAEEGPAPSEPEPEPVPQLEWSECRTGLECADLQVPLDHDDPDGEKITIALARRPARDPGSRIGSVVVNPGGPGASGITAVSYMLLPAAVTERFDVVGFDPRGVGDSTALDCHSHLQAIYDADPTMEDAADADHYRTVSEDFVEECEVGHADLLPHLGTEDVARDLDLIRSALGDDGLTYVGYSYGTSIGQQYARLFPHKVRAMVLDGVVDLDRTGLEAAEDQARGFTRAMDAYVAECDATNCFGAPTREVVGQVIASSEAEPIPAPGADRPATPGVVTLALSQAMYSRLLWSRLTSALRDAGEGDATGLVALADSYLQRQSDGSYANGFEIYFGVSCLDSQWPDSFDEVLAAGKDVGSRYPIFGEALVNDYARCALWPGEADPLEPIPADIEGLAPLLFISTTGDPATPHESGVKVAAAIPGARLITNVGEGHTVFASGKPCIDRAASAYLVDLTLPDEDLRCD